ncbi:MAG: trypsin-like peptidase domain-containing protein [candidate division KSB1 bacterium]|nr:trypsin-like peptidase domain-containing protein [candidate division KSB1 bacterium]MDZ7274691.1 trypsin-like peptidase domain-containing protein [candidate division KSB1 bacterium]MDZ7285516.1 trypsin-like peptidase domain-containing protein [candidate division KSB1 bacterium]MDZ7298548.1 trypsin-like peptidase domain-containing protein [candidate division KSB1 bacterium]MDZ7306600.1 trypsin-like peptidase domain-containing protein [candidate division KSB1 bacterium]
MSRHRFSLLPSLIFGIVAGIAIATVYFHTPAPTRQEPPARRDSLTIAPVAARTENNALLEDERNTIEIFQRASPSVVFIVNKALRRDFFSLDVFEVQQGSGSGFIWDHNGYIVTNYHVVQDGNAWSVTLSDNSTYDAELIGSEPSKDIAVVKIDAPRAKLSPVVVGSSENLRVGQKVIAIGNPFGLDQTLTTGVVSALGRQIKSSNNRTIEGVIQTDAAINPGNSGGPLLNSQGELIGINTAIYSTSGSSAGIGFAVPVNIVKRVVPQLIRYGKVIRPGLGVSIVDDSFARRWGIKGVIIGRVQPGGAAARAGLRGITQNRWGEVRLGDIITGINGRRVTNFDELSNELERYQIGETVTVNILRGEDEMSVRVRLQEL